jgi:vancomycin permeability regulator SanA
MRTGPDQNEDTPVPSGNDAVIVIFGAAVRPDGSPSPTLRHRVDAAARFGRQFRNPLFIPTGAKGRYGDAEATVMARQLRALGYVSTAIRLETTGTDTLSSVRAIRRMLPTSLRPTLFACSSAYHLPRCLLLMRLAGLRPRACPPPPVPAATSRLLRWFWRLREAPAIPYDAMLMLWLRAVRRM